MSRTFKQQWKISRVGSAVLLSVLFFIGLATPAAADWPMFLKDPARSSFAAEAPRPPLRLKWKFTTGGPVYSSPVVSGGRVYVGSYDKKLYALDEKTGELLWTFATGGEILSTPAVADGRVFFGSKDHNVYALDAESGKLLWKYETEGKVLTSPVVAGKRVFIASNDRYLYALDAEKGKRLWRMRVFDYPPYSGIYASPAYSEGSVIVVGKNGRIYSQDAKDGGRNWLVVTVSVVYASPVIKDGRVYVATGDRRLLGMDLKTGKVVYRVNLGSGFAYASPVVSGGKIYLALKDGHIRVYETKRRRKMVADYRLPAPVNSTPVVTSNGFLYVGCENGRLYAIDLILGDINWTFTTGKGIHASPAISDGMVFIGSKDGSIYAFGH